MKSKDRQTVAAKESQPVSPCDLDNPVTNDLFKSADLAERRHVFIDQKLKCAKFSILKM